MANTSKNLYEGQLAATAAPNPALYTVPASTRTIVSEIILCESSGNARTVTIRYNGDAASNNVYTALALAANETLVLGHNTVLEAGDIIRAFASVAASVNMYVSGMEITA